MTKSQVKNWGGTLLSELDFSGGMTALEIYPRDSYRAELERKYKGLINENLRLGQFVSYVGNRGVPFLRLYRYKEAFSFHLVKFFFQKFNVNSYDYVFDPFSGLGTTLFTAFVHNIPSVGIDKLPLAHFMSKTIPRFLFLREGEVSEIWRSIKQNFWMNEPADVALDVPIMDSAFDKETLLTLRKLKTSIENLPDPHKDLFLFLFFSIIEECSFTSKDGQFLRLRRDKRVPDPLTAMDRKVAQVEEDIRMMRLLYPKMDLDRGNFPDVYLADARDLSNIEFKRPPTLIVTSPPYVNRYDYTRTYSLELCFHFVKNFDELKSLRLSVLRSHIESRIGTRENPPHPAVEEVVDVLSTKKLNNPRIPKMIMAYFIDMQHVIDEWIKILAPDAKVVMVVDNVRFEGEMIPVDLILSDMAEDAGFKVLEIIVARYKGNSSQQMKKYGRIPVRESIVIWER